MTPEATLADALWRVSAEDPEALTLGYDDLHRWDDDVRGAFVALGILEVSTPASRVVCPDCEAGHVEDVQWFDDQQGPSHAVIRCPEYGRVELSLETLCTWRLAPAALAGELNRLVKGHGPGREVIAGRIWSIGIGGDGNPDLLLVRGRCWRDASSLEPEIARRAASLVVFSAADCKSGDDTVLGDVLGWRGDTLTIDRDRLLAGMSANRSDPDEPYQFRRTGDGWLIGFEGRSFIAKDLKGMGLIHNLLQKPNEWLSLIDIVPIAQCGLELVDQQTIREVRRLTRESAATRKQLQAFLGKVTRLDGSPRLTNSPADRAANNVRMAIARSVEHLRSKHPELAGHFDRSIRTGLAVSYQTDLGLTWRT